MNAGSFLWDFVDVGHQDKIVFAGIRNAAENSIALPRLTLQGIFGVRHVSDDHMPDPGGKWREASVKRVEARLLAKPTEGRVGLDDYEAEDRKALERLSLG